MAYPRARAPVASSPCAAPETVVNEDGENENGNTQMRGVPPLQGLGDEQRQRELLNLMENSNSSPVQRAGILKIFPLLSCCFGMELLLATRFLQSALKEIASGESKDASEIRNMLAEIDDIQSANTIRANSSYLQTIVTTAHFYQRAMKWIAKYSKDEKAKLLQFQIVSRHNLLASFVPVVRDTPSLRGHPFAFPDQPLINRILHCRDFSDIRKLCQTSDLPMAFDCLRANREYLRPFDTMRVEGDADKLRFWRIQNAKESFLAVMHLLFEENLYSTLGSKEKERLNMKLKDAFECALMMEKIVCLFFSRGYVASENGLPWYQRMIFNGTLEVTSNEIETFLKENHLSYPTIDHMYITTVQRLFPDLVEHLLPCVPERNPQPTDTVALRWKRKYVRLPGGDIGCYWGSELRSQTPQTSG